MALQILAAAGLGLQAAGLFGSSRAQEEAAEADARRAQANVDIATLDSNVRARDIVRNARQQVANVRAQAAARGVGVESSGVQGAIGSTVSQVASETGLARRRFFRGIDAIAAGADAQGAIARAGAFSALGNVGAGVFNAAGGFAAFRGQGGNTTTTSTPAFSGTPQSSPVAARSPVQMIFGQN